MALHLNAIEQAPTEHLRQRGFVRYDLIAAGAALAGLAIGALGFAASWIAGDAVFNVLFPPE